MPVSDPVAKNTSPSGGDGGHDLGQILQPALAVDQDIEGRIAKQAQRQREAVAMAAAGATGGGHCPYLR